MKTAGPSQTVMSLEFSKAALLIGPPFSLQAAIKLKGGENHAHKILWTIQSARDMQAFYPDWLLPSTSDLTPQLKKE